MIAFNCRSLIVTINNTSIIKALQRPIESGQYTSWTFSQKVRSAGLVQSIGTVGDAYHNAVIESFRGTMQIELLNSKRWNTRIELCAAIVDWIEAFCNRRRRHSTLGNMSPIDHERRQQHRAAA